MRIAVRPALSAWSTSVISTTNSSPPCRLTVSDAADARHQAPGNRLQQPIADGVAQRIVDVLEIVQVEEEDRNLMPCGAAAAAIARPTRSLQQQAIGQAGQEIVVRGVRHLGDHHPHRGDVTEDDQGADDHPARS